MTIPEFAILGHPNEGKSSVLSTLAEDDSVRVSPIPGETTECRSFPVIIDGREVLRFTDTPGFQNPARVLVRDETAGQGGRKSAGGIPPVRRRRPGTARRLRTPRTRWSGARESSMWSTARARSGMSTAPRWRSCG